MLQIRHSVENAVPSRGNELTLPGVLDILRVVERTVVANVVLTSDNGLVLLHVCQDRWQRENVPLGANGGFFKQPPQQDNLAPEVPIMYQLHQTIWDWMRHRLFGVQPEPFVERPVDKVLPCKFDKLLFDGVYVIAG